MRRLNLALLATLQLCGAGARSFNVHEDLLAFPQFEVIFSDDWISEKDAQALLDGDAPQPTYSSDLSRATADDERETEGDGGEATGRQYEIMNLVSQQYLCTIPVMQAAAPENKTANELAKAEEVRELSRATESGWELLGGLGDHCLYFGSGWWSYRFCKNREVVQFHAAAATPPGQPPRRDPSTAEYVLGSVPALPATSAQNDRDSEAKPLPAEVQVKGDQRYLVQRLEGGTICDLTGRERTIEVQYHCVPGMREPRISWLKEVTICAYLMVVNTPQLCDDVAFLPPKETKANPISCRPVLDNDAEPPLLGQDKEESELTPDMGESAWVSDDQTPLKAPQPERQTVGGIVVGARNVLSKGDEAGKPPIKLSPPRRHNRHLDADDFVELIGQVASKAGADEGEIDVLGLDDLKELEIDPEVIKEMKDEVKRLAGDNGWRIEIVELPNHDREVRGYVEGDEEEEGDSKGKGQDGSKERPYKDEL